MEALQKNLPKIIVPNESQPIYRSKCIYSNDGPESPTGLYVNLTTFLGFSEGYAERYAEKTGYVVFLHIKRNKHLKQDCSDLRQESANEECGPEQETTHLAVGVKGGQIEDHAEEYEFKNTYSIVVMPDKDNKLPYPSQNLPMIVTQAVEALLSADSAITKLEKLAAGTWDGEVRQVSKFAEELKQWDNGKKIPPSGWKCEKCDLTNNLWLNLTDGSILCGRKFFDGSGGNDHAAQYYKETGFPLAVKLGTIRADGKLDVFSYPEDDMVIDPKLNEHLTHFGINMDTMKKSEKSMVEMELDITQLIGEWSLLTESESENELHFINAFL